MPFARFKDTSTGHEITLDEAYGKATEGLTHLPHKDAVDVNGRPLPAKHRTTLSGKPAKGTTTTEKKES